MKKSFYSLLLIFTLLLVSACGSNKAANETTNTAVASTPVPSATVEPTAEPAEPLTIVGANGEVTLDTPAKRIVTLEYTYTEDVLALGLQPVGAADIEGYKKWVNVEAALNGDVIDVGTRNEPSLEQIAALEPDLIIGISFRHEKILADLESIAPTILFNPYPDETANISQYDEMLDTLGQIAAATGTTETANSETAKLETRFAELNAKLKGANLATNKFILSQMFTSSDAPQFRLFAGNSVASTLLEKIGLENAFESEAFEAYGYSTVNLEGLVNLEDANFFYVAQDSDPILDTLNASPVWNNLHFVHNDQLLALGGDSWLFGGPLSAMTLLDRIENLLFQ